MGPGQRIGQIVRQVAKKAGITKRVFPHLLRPTFVASAIYRS